jgi:predicted RNase H-like HicB family nuclease
MTQTISLPKVRVKVDLRRGEIGYWVAECPGLPGCVSQGKTRAAALANIGEAIQAWLESAQAHPETWAASSR